MKKLLKLSVVSLFALAVSSCADWFQGKIPMTDNGEASSLEELLTPAVKITQLDTPEQISASQGRYKNKILISWSEVDYATSYNIERAVVTKNDSGTYSIPEDSDFETLNNYVAKTTYEDTILFDPGAEDAEYSNVYFYRVSAENISKGYEASEFTDFTVTDYDGKGWLLAPPKNATASKGTSTDYVTVTWDAVDGASYYKIYRGTSSDGSGAIALATVYGDQTSYNNAIGSDNQGVEFYYKLSALIKTTSGYEESACGTLAMGYAVKDGAPSAPTADTITVTGYGVTTDALTITWPVKTDINNTVSYNLYRNSSTDSVFTCVKSSFAPTGETASYRDESVSPGQLYYYYIQTIFTNKTSGEISKSPFSTTGADSDIPAKGFLLSAPTDIDVADGSTDQSIVLKWKPAVGADLVEGGVTYIIKRSSSADGDYTALMSAVTGGTADDEGYLSQEIQKEDFIRISTYNSAVSLESENSSAVAPQPAAPVDVEASKTKNLASEMDSAWTPNDNEVYPVRITWKKPVTDNPSMYYVYRSVKPAASFKKIAEVTAPDNNSSTVISYYDSNSTAKAGIFYYYKVVSVNSLGQGKKGNDPSTDSERSSWGYGALTRDQWFREYNKEVATSQAKLVLMHKASDLDKVGSETIYAFLPVNGSIGSLSYKAAVAGLGAEITMPYTNYADHVIVSNGNLLGYMFILNGNTDTTSNMSANGNMHETVQCYHYDDFVFTAATSYTFKDTNSKNGGSKEYTGEIYDYVNSTSYSAATGDLHLFQGMYPGSANYDNLEIKGGAAGGGYYLVTTYELDRKSSSTGTVIFAEDKVDWLVGEED